MTLIAANISGIGPTELLCLGMGIAVVILGCLGALALTLALWFLGSRGN